MKKTGLSIVVFAFLLTGCTYSSENLKPQTDFFTTSTGFVKYEIRLRPNEDGTISLPINSRCKKGTGAKEGCIAFEPGRYGSLKLSVSNAGHDDKVCSDGGVRWVITKVQIADSGNIDTGKSLDFGNPVSSATEAALYPFKEPSTGTVYEQADVSLARTSFVMLNRNDNPAGTTEDFWYYVEATNCRNNAIVAKTDPRIENEGR